MPLYGLPMSTAFGVHFYLLPWKGVRLEMESLEQHQVWGETSIMLCGCPALLGVGVVWLQVAWAESLRVESRLALFPLCVFPFFTPGSLPQRNGVLMQIGPTCRQRSDELPVLVSMAPLRHSLWYKSPLTLTADHCPCLLCLVVELPSGLAGACMDTQPVSGD